MRPNGWGPVARSTAPPGRPRPAVELEDTESVAALHEGVRRGVVEREVLEHDRLAAVALDVLHRVVEDGEVAQPEEVHLDQPEVLAHRVVELRDDGAVLR